MKKKFNLMIYILFFLLTGIVFAQQWSIQTIDQIGDVGKYSNLKIGLNNKPRIVYYNETNGFSQLATFDGNNWEIEVIDNSGDIGSYIGFATNQNDDGSLVYRNNSNGDVIYNGYLESLLNWDIQIIDQTAYVGKYSEINFGVNNNPRIAYYDETNSYVKLATYDGSNWTNQVIDNSGDIGSYIGFATNQNDDGSLIYRNNSNGDVIYNGYIQSTLNWDFQIIDQSGNVGKYSSIDLNDINNPIVAYKDVSNIKLKAAEFKNEQWEIELVDNSGNHIGTYSSLTISPNKEKAGIVYFDEDLTAVKLAQKLIKTQLVIISPNGNENWEVGFSYDIVWTTPIEINNINIKYSTDNGSSWFTITNNTENDGIYSWLIPNNPSNNCFVKIIDTDDTSNFDIGNSSFTIVPKAITVISPNGGEMWPISSHQEIQWSTAGTIDNVQLEYSSDSCQNWETIFDSTSNDGCEIWQVPENISSNSYIRISDISNLAVFDISDQSFSIIAPILIVDDSLDFGILTLGEIKVDTLLVSNIGNIDLALSEITVFGDAFSLLSNNTLIVLPDSSGEIVVKFEIYTPGSHYGAINWIDNDYVGIDSVSLIGSTIPVPVISFMNGNFNFGNVALNISEDHEIIIKNTGIDTLYISEITISDTVFTLNYNTSITVLAPDDTLSVIVTFQPTSVGTFSAIITVSDSMNDLSNFTTVQGNGEGAILTTESIFNYPIVPIFSSTTSEIIITNDGNIDLEITDMIFINQLFEIYIDFPLIVLPEFEATIPINYESNNLGEVEDTLTIESNNYLGDKEVIIIANSILPDIRIYVEVNIFIDSLDFGTVRSGDKVDTTFMIAHFEDENYQVTIDSIIISGSEASYFHNNATIPFVLEYQDEHQINFEYQPQAIGNHKAIASFYSGGINLKDIVLSGNCIPNQSPNVSNLNLASSIYSHDIEIQYELSDWENDTLALNLEYFINDIWEEATLNMPLDNISPPNYSSVFMWLSNEDLKGYYENLPLRLVVSDYFGAVTNSDTTDINLANLVGDLVFITEDEIGVGFEDIIPFSDAWKTTGEIDNIGPVTGTIPNVIPSDLPAEQIIDFEDLCVFIQMWNWSTENLNFKYFEKIFLAKQSNDVDANIQYISDNNFDINISLNTEARAFELIMFLDSDFFEVVSISKSVENDNIILLSYQNERFLKVNIVNLDRSNLPIDKSLISIAINFTNDNLIFDLDGVYELRDSSNAILSNNLLNIPVDLSEFLPKEFILFQNYPNPFNLTTSIRFSLPKSTNMKLQIYNLKGQLVEMLVDKHILAGYHTIEWNAKDMSSGIYFYKLQAGDKTFIKKMILMR